MGAAGTLLAAGLVTGSVTSALSGVQRANAEIAASKMRGREARAESGRIAEKIRREGDAFLQEQRVAIGASGVERSGSALDILAANAETIEKDALTVIHDGINVARLEVARRTKIREGRDQSLLMSFLLPGGSASGFSAIGQAYGQSQTARVLQVQNERLGRIGTKLAGQP